MRVIALHGVAAARPAHTVSPGGAGSAPPHLDAIVARLCPVCRALPALGHGGRRSLAGRGAVAAALAVSARALTDLGLRQRPGQRQRGRKCNDDEQGSLHRSSTIFLPTLTP